MPVPEGSRTDLLRRITYPLLSFVTVVVASVVGFVALADIGLVDATFWIIDPTSIELHFESHPDETTEKATKAFSVLTRVLLVVTGAWIAESVLSLAFGGRITEGVKRVQIMNEIEKLEDHVIVCGYGMFGRTVASRLENRGVDVVVIEKDPTEYEKAISDGVLAFEGDGRREEALRSVGVERAKSVVCAVDNSNANIEMAIVVNQVSPECRLVVRVGDEMYESLARRAGADEVVIPEVVSGERVTEDI
jgi:hypothetical protein